MGVSKAAATWVFCVAAIAAALGFTQWQKADRDVEWSGEEPDRTAALLLFGAAGVGAVCGTLIYVNAPDEGDPPDQEAPRDPDPPPLP